MSVEHITGGLDNVPRVHQKFGLEIKILNYVISIQMVIKAMIVDEIASLEFVYGLRTKSWYSFNLY